jgi:hypothetical protein
MDYKERHTEASGRMERIGQARLFGLYFYYDFTAGSAHLVRDY